MPITDGHQNDKRKGTIENGTMQINQLSGVATIPLGTVNDKEHSSIIEMTGKFLTNIG